MGNSKTTVTDIGDHSVSVTSLEDLSSMAAPWRKDHDEEESESEDEEIEEAEEAELPGMDLKQKPAEKKEKVYLDAKERKSINKSAIKMLHTSKAFKAKEKIKAKKMRNSAR